MKRKEKNKIRRWTSGAEKERNGQSGERARTNIQEEKKNENRREIGILNKRDERGN